VRYLGDEFPPFRDHHCEEGHEQPGPGHIADLNRGK
jgi:hypothetical protein